MKSEIIYTIAFLIASPIFLILSLETKKRLFFFISISLVGLYVIYVIYVIYLMSKQDVTFIFLLHHITVFLALITPYFYISETETEKDKRNKYLNRIILILCLLIIFTTSK